MTSGSAWQAMRWSWPISTSEGVTVSINTWKDRPWGQLVLTPDLENGGQTISEGLEHNSRLRTQINVAFVVRPKTAPSAPPPPGCPQPDRRG